MKTLTLLAALFLAAPAFAGSCPAGESVVRVAVENHVVISVESGYRTWLMGRDWYVTPLPVKRQLIAGFAAVRKRCEGRPWVVLQDGYTGVKIGAFTASGPKVYR